MRNLSVLILMGLLGSMTLFGSTLVSAQAWEAVTRPSTTGADTTSVVVQNDEGYVFEVGSISGRQARCAFRLPEGGAEQLDGAKTPLLTVDAYDPQRVTTWPDPVEPEEDGGDFRESARRSIGGAPLISATSSEVRFVCWLGLKEQSSPTRGALRQIMDGEELMVRFHLSDGGYDEAVFPLEGAREVIAETFGIGEQPTEKDLLQDALLRLRVQYRGSTCYLLAGKKNLNRCLDAVNRCAAQSQDSLVSMLGCVEVE